MLSKPEAFFAHIRANLFGGKLSPGQVDGLNRLLSIWDDYMRGPLDELAYDLATSFHETAQTMQPITERGAKAYFNKYEPGTRIGKILGNTQPGDGYRFRGEGDVQNTGRANAEKATKRLNELFGLGIDLVAHPELRGDPKISALSLFIGNREGWWTGKGLNEYLDGIDEADAEDLREFINSRPVVNGTDKAKAIAGHALVFEAALKAGGYRPSLPAPPVAPIDVTTTVTTDPPRSRAGLIIIVVLIALALAGAFFWKGF